MGRTTGTVSAEIKAKTESVKIPEGISVELPVIPVFRNRT
jgi:hypothetical protein